MFMKGDFRLPTIQFNLKAMLAQFAMGTILKSLLKR
jgi:hypothetical protein